MMENKEIRRLNLVMLVGKYGGQAGLGGKTLTAPSIFSAIINKAPGRHMGDRLARKIEERLRLPRGWLDVRHETYDEALDSGPSAQPEITQPLVEFKKSVQEARDAIEQLTERLRQQEEREAAKTRQEALSSRREGQKKHGRLK